MRRGETTTAQPLWLSRGVWTSVGWSAERLEGGDGTHRDGPAGADDREDYGVGSANGPPAIDHSPVMDRSQVAHQRPWPRQRTPSWSCISVPES